MPHFNSFQTLARSILLAALFGSPGWGAEEPGTESGYVNAIRPILDQYCIDCHGPETQKGDLRLDTLDPTFAGPAAETWHDVLDQLTLGEMPPEKKPQPNAPERRTLVDWVRTGVDRAARERRGGDHAVIRRLTRYEYNNTLRDLLGAEGDFAQDLPPDSRSEDGFNNNGRSLGISPLQIETYLAAARAALDQVIVTGPAPEVHRHRFTEPTKGRSRGTPTKQMRPHQFFTANMETFPRRGAFRIRVHAQAITPDGAGVPQLKARIGLRADVKSPSREIKTIDVTGSETNVYEFTGRIEDYPLPGHNPKFPGLTITLENVHDDGLGPDKPYKHKAISLPGDLQKAVKQAVKDMPPLLTLSEADRRQAAKTLKEFERQASRLQTYIETLRHIDPKDPNQIDIAFRLYDAQNAFKDLEKRLKSVARDVKLDAKELWKTTRIDAAERLADHAAVLARFEGIDPINRKDKKQAPPPPAGPPRPTIVVDSLEFVGPVFETWPPAAHRRLLASDAPSERERAQEALSRFIARAFRRPTRPADLDLVMPFYDEIRSAGSFEETMRECFALLLVSPEFLFLVEPATDATPRTLTAHELASRLSYFLHATLPDEALTTHADSGALLQLDTLEHEVRRLLDHPHSGEFVRHFTDQWLDLSGIDRVAVNPEYYPGFDEQLKPMMREEIRQLFGEVLRKDLSALSLLDADFAMLNRPLAEHYGIGPDDHGIAGTTFERVALRPEHQRGGLLSSAGVLLLNSTGEDSHPIRRAVWVLDRLLGDPPAPPPPDVPDLESDSPDFAKLSIKQQLELHREKEACNDCHRGIDPWGIPFEGYDAIGLPRTETVRVVDRKRLRSPVEQVADLPDGHTIDGLEALKAHLLKHERRRFARTLTEKVLAYGLGRSLEFGDRPEVESLTDRFEASGYKLGELIVHIAKSPTFQRK